MRTGHVIQIIMAARGKLDPFLSDGFVYSFMVYPLGNAVVYTSS